jgi:hypothetical protein
MTDNPAHQQHIQWLQTQLAQQKQDLEAAESKLAETKALVEQKRESVAYYQSMLDAVVSDEISSSSCLSGTASSVPGNTSNQNGSRATSSIPVYGDKDCEDMKLEKEEVEDEELEDEEFKEENKRKPKDMLRPEFKNMTLGDAAQEIIDQNRSALKPEQIAEQMFDPKSEEERQRAKNSLATELRRGAKDGRWKKIDRGFFVSNLVNMHSKTLPLSIEQLSRFETINNGSSLDS